MPTRPRSSDRRTEIARAVIDVVAEEGVRALTHRGVDRRLGLPPGSTSFYARSRRALIELGVRELTARARAAFEDTGVRPPGRTAPPLKHTAVLIADFLVRMLTEHRSDLVARWALALELRGDEELCAMLAHSTFSHEAAEGLMRALHVPEPVRAAANLVGLLEGLLLDRLVGHRSVQTGGAPRRDFEAAVLAFLRGVSPTPESR